MDTAEKRTARVEELDQMATKGPWTHCDCGRCGLIWDGSGEFNIGQVDKQNDSGSIHEAERQANAMFIAESRALLPALAADAQRAGRYERNLCSIAKVLTDAGVPLTVETADGPTIDRIHERVAHLVDAAKRAREEATFWKRNFDIASGERLTWIQRARTFEDQRDQAKRSNEAAERQVGKQIQARGRACEARKEAEQERDRAIERCARWAESKDPRDEAEVVRVRGQLAIVSLPKGGE